jgi:hypothetical protein
MIPLVGAQGRSLAAASAERDENELCQGIPKPRAGCEDPFGSPGTGGTVPIINEPRDRRSDSDIRYPIQEALGPLQPHMMAQQ